MKKIVRKLSLVMAVAMILACMSPIAAQAKKKAKGITLSGSGFSTSTAVAESTAIPVGLGAMTVNAPKNGTGFLKFTAPATRAYSFNFSKYKAKKYACGHFYIMKAYGRNNQYIGMEKVVTEGGASSALYVATKKSKFGDMATRYLKSRTGTIALQQGQTVYLYFSLTRKGSFRLKIG